MHADGNIQYANYQSKQEVVDYLAKNGWAAATTNGWFV
jgi:serralysin